jgi:hypothetical protein
MIKRRAEPAARSFAPEAFRPRAPVACELVFDRDNKLTGRVAGAIDLLVDFATLGEYGLEPLPADGRCELDGQRAGWEALATLRRGSCRKPTTRTRESRARVHG